MMTDNCFYRSGLVELWKKACQTVLHERKTLNRQLTCLISSSTSSSFFLGCFFFFFISFVTSHRGLCVCICVCLCVCVSKSPNIRSQVLVYISFNLPFRQKLRDFQTHRCLPLSKFNLKCSAQHLL